MGHRPRQAPEVYGHALLLWKRHPSIHPCLLSRGVFFSPTSFSEFQTISSCSSYSWRKNQIKLLYVFQDFEKTWASEATCYQLSKPRSFPVETLGVDISEPALEFGKKAGIFDEILKLDLNALSVSESQLLKANCESANIMHINSSGYINEDVIHQIIDWFAAGKEPGMIAFALVYPLEGRERIYRLRTHLLEKFKFMESISMIHRNVTDFERQKFGPEYGIWNRFSYDLWYMTRF